MSFKSSVAASPVLSPYRLICWPLLCQSVISFSCTSCRFFSPTIGTPALRCHWGQDVWLLLDQQWVIAAMSVYFCETESLKKLSGTPVCVYSPHFLTYHMHRIQICSLFLSLSGLQFLHSQNNAMNHDSHAGPTYILLHMQLSLHVWGLPQLFSMFELDRWILGGKYLSTSFQIVRIKPGVCLCVTLGYEQRIITNAEASGVKTLKKPAALTWHRCCSGQITGLSVKLLDTVGLAFWQPPGLKNKANTEVPKTSCPGVLAGSKRVSISKKAHVNMAHLTALKSFFTALYKEWCWPLWMV